MDLRFNGSKNDLEKLLTQFISKDVVKKLIDGFENYSFAISGEEYIKIENEYKESLPDTLSLVTPLKKYNINITATTTVALLILLDLITLGISDRLLEWIGVNPKMQGIYKLDCEVEKCIIIEMLRSKSHTVDETILPPAAQACFNNDLQCKFRSNDKCTIRKGDVINALTKLCEKNVVRKQGSYFKYNF